MLDLACLFWFYKDADICENRLKIFRAYNPNAKVYGLYGGDLAQFPEFERRLGRYFDDLYAFEEDRPTLWKWRNGDIMIGRWFSERGQYLAWDTIFVAQWDMLVFGRLEKLFSGLRKDELLFSGLRPISEVDPWWWYIRIGSSERSEYEAFFSMVKQRYEFSQEPLCGELIVLCMPRTFLEKYVDIPDPELGFLEYKIPIYAQIFGTPFCTRHPYIPWWGDDPEADKVPLLKRALNSETQNVPLRVILVHLLLPKGQRIFHPVFYIYPLTFLERLLALAIELRDEVLRPTWWRLHRRIFGESV